MNRQTKSLRKQDKSLKFNHGVDFSTHSSFTARELAAHPEFEIVERPRIRGVNVNSSTARPRRRYNPLRIETGKHVFCVNRDALLAARRFA